MWYEWNSLEEFNSWHTSICASLGIPNENTTAYTDVYEIDGVFIAVVHDSESGGLKSTELRPFIIERI